MKKQTIFAIATMLLLSGCDTNNLYTGTTSYGSEPIQVSNGLVLHNQTDDQIKLLHVSSSNITSKPLFVPQSGELIHRIFTGPAAKKSNQLFVTTYPASERETNIAPALNIISTLDGSTTRYETGSVFGKYKFGPEERYIILYHDNGDGNLSGGLFNPNEIAIINRNTKPSVLNPKLTTIDISGHTVEDIVFLDAVQVGTVLRKFVAFVTRGMIQFTDFNSPNFASIHVSLQHEADSRTIVPRKFKLINGTANSGPRVFVLASGATEVFDIEFNPKNNETGFYATTSLLDGGESPSDFTLLHDNDMLFLITVSSAYAQMNIFDVATASMTSVALQDRMSTILERTNNGMMELVFYGESTQNMYILPTADIGKEKGDNIEKFNVPSGISHTRKLDNDRLLIYPQSGSSIIIADLRTRTITPLSSSENVQFFDKGILWKETFFLNQEGRIAYLNITTGSPNKLALDEQCSNFFVFEHQGIGLAMHNSPTGRATIFPLSNPRRAVASIIDGFWVDGFVEGEEE